MKVPSMYLLLLWFLTCLIPRHGPSSRCKEMDIMVQLPSMRCTTCGVIHTGNHLGCHGNHMACLVTTGECIAQPLGWFHHKSLSPDLYCYFLMQIFIRKCLIFVLYMIYQWVSVSLGHQQWNYIFLALTHEYYLYSKWKCHSDHHWNWQT